MFNTGGSFGDSGLGDGGGERAKFAEFLGNLKAVRQSSARPGLWLQKLMK